MFYYNEENDSTQSFMKSIAGITDYYIFFVLKTKRGKPKYGHIHMHISAGLLPEIISYLKHAKGKQIFGTFPWILVRIAFQIFVIRLGYKWLMYRSEMH